MEHEHTKRQWVPFVIGLVVALGIGAGMFLATLMAVQNPRQRKQPVAQVAEL